MPDTASRPHVVVTNDDGIESEGLRQLALTAAAQDLDVLIAAPQAEASGSSAAMTSARDGDQITLITRELPGLAGVPGYAVPAAPAFIAFTAARGGFGCRPHMLLSGINHGPNLGQAILHSGTVGAALTAAAHGVPAAAFSLDLRGSAGPAALPPQWQTACLVARQVIAVLRGLPAAVVLNVNVPNVPPGQLRGIRRASLAPFGAVEVTGTAAGGSLRVTVSDAQPAPGTDSALLAGHWASVTPLRGICEVPLPGLPWPAGRA